MYKTKDDEGKGSPSQDGANYQAFTSPSRRGRVRQENRQISGSPSGAPSPVSSFPPKKKSC